MNNPIYIATGLHLYSRDDVPHLSRLRTTGTICWEFRNGNADCAIYGTNEVIQEMWRKLTQFLRENDLLPDEESDSYGNGHRQSLKPRK